MNASPERIADASEADRDLAPPVRIARDHWIACLDGIAGDETLRSWCAQPRFRRRLLARLQHRHGLVAMADLPRLDDVDRVLCQLDDNGFIACARAAGAIVHANAFVREIHAPRVAALKQRFGADLYALALAHRDRATAEFHAGEDLDALETAIERDGRRCLQQWWQAQPAPLRAWLRLGWAGRLESSETLAANADAVDVARLAAAHAISRANDEEPAEE